MQDVTPDSCSTILFTMQDVTPDSCCLKIDMLREGFSWFEQRGAKPMNVKVRVV